MNLGMLERNERRRLCYDRDQERCAKLVFARILFSHHQLDTQNFGALFAEFELK